MIPLAKNLALPVLCLGVATLAYALWHWRNRKRQAKKLFVEADATLEAARLDAEKIKRDALLTANAESTQQRAQTETFSHTRRAEIADSEKRLADREAMLNSQLEVLLRTENKLRQESESVSRRAEELDVEKRELHRLTQLRKDQLAREAHITEAEARTQLLREVEVEALSDASKLTRHILDDAKARADEKARHLISLAIQRYASAHTSDVTTATITLP
ncbi:MAG: hypothetical protein RL380_504, partial [Verrucomicrobiota bacterium]